MVTRASIAPMQRFSTMVCYYCFVVFHLFYNVNGTRGCEEKHRRISLKSKYCVCVVYCGTYPSPICPPSLVGANCASSPYSMIEQMTDPTELTATVAMLTASQDLRRHVDKTPAQDWQWLYFKNA